LFAQPSTDNFCSFGTGIGNIIYVYVVADRIRYTVYTTASITQNSWSHVAAKWVSATKSIEIYFNGVLQAGNPSGTSSTGTNGLMVLGSRPGGFQFFDGQLDEVRVWNTARSETEIQDNMNTIIDPS